MHVIASFSRALLNFNRFVIPCNISLATRESGCELIKWFYKHCFASCPSIEGAWLESCDDGFVTALQIGIFNLNKCLNTAKYSSCRASVVRFYYRNYFWQLSLLIVSSAARWKKGFEPDERLQPRRVQNHFFNSSSQTVQFIREIL